MAQSSVAQPSATRDGLTAAQRRDVRWAARVARHDGTVIRMHGQLCGTLATRPNGSQKVSSQHSSSKPCTQRDAGAQTQPEAGGGGRTQQRDGERRQQPLEASATAEVVSTRKQQRSKQRLKEFQQLKRKQRWQRVFHAFRRQYRAKRRADVWTEHMRQLLSSEAAQSRAAAATADPRDAAMEEAETADEQRGSKRTGRSPGGVKTAPPAATKRGAAAQKAGAQEAVRRLAAGISSAAAARNSARQGAARTLHFSRQAETGSSRHDALLEAAGLGEAP